MAWGVGPIPIPQALRGKVVPVLVVALGFIAIAAISTLQERSNSSSSAQLTLVNARFTLQKLQRAAISASPTLGGSPRRFGAIINTGKRRVAGSIRELNRDSPPAPLRSSAPWLKRDFAAIDAVYAYAASGRELDKNFDKLAARATASQVRVDKLLDAAAREYEGRAARTQTQATVGSVAVILLLLAAFGFLYRRSEMIGRTARSLAEENARLLKGSRIEAVTDDLTGVRNRRALTADLERRSNPATANTPSMLVLFDLDGFKQYNDTFGHPAGDALLARMAGRLEAAVDGLGDAYRMGGDEFCVLAPASLAEGPLLIRAASALSESGEAFGIGCSYGKALMPAEAASAEEALRIADQRMYAAKTERSSASRQSTDVLLKVLSERSPALGVHRSGVAQLAEDTAGALGLPEHEVTRIRLAAELHDIGKVAIPTEILNKSSTLDRREWEFIRSHTEIGERIVRAAPSLSHTAELVRSSHEWHDGHGYPDSLSGEDIPIGASIISVCDAFDAMVSDRPYGMGRTTAEALTELARCSGTQFRPDVVTAFAAPAEARADAGVPA